MNGTNFSFADLQDDKYTPKLPSTTSERTGWSSPAPIPTPTSRTTTTNTIQSNLPSPTTSTSTYGEYEDEYIGFDNLNRRILPVLWKKNLWGFEGEYSLYYEYKINVDLEANIACIIDIKLMMIWGRLLPVLWI